MRPWRIKYSNAIYHIMNRGAGGKKIFQIDSDRDAFLSILKQVHAKYRIEIFAYCLMSNHYHLIVHTPLPNISSAMCLLDGLYAKNFNKRYMTYGPLFSGRFISPLITTDEYLIQASRYIHLNPVKAGMIARPEDYYWSSCRFYTTQRLHCSWLTTDRILEYFSPLEDRSRELYLAYINNEEETIA